MAPPPDHTATLAPRSLPAASGSVPPEPGDHDDDDLPEVELPIDDPERYEQVGEHGRGGLGRVTRAVDKRLGRTVAVKELLRHDEWHEARFVREALITARLEHPGIVPVHEAGRWPNGDPYYVMKLVEGRTLKELFAEAKSLRDRLSLLPHVIAIADAVGYAHREGVIHRDLKPANVVVGAFGETVVVDWGLARDRTQDPPELPGTGVVGTPAYMAPEQARGEPIDERIDVYAIGAILYELLCGFAPYLGAGTPDSDRTPQAILARVLDGPPAPLACGPKELVDVVRKAMALDPERRYANATALAEDLRRFQTGKLVSAHAYTTWHRIQRKLAAHKGVALVAAASAIALAAIGVESFHTVVEERDIAQSERARAESRERDLVLVEARTSLDKDPTAALAWLKRYRLGDDTADAVDIADAARALGVARHVLRPGDWVLDARFTPDGQTLVAAVRDGKVLAYDTATGVQRLLGRTRSAPDVLAIAPEGNVAITGTMLGEVVAWPLDGGPSRMLVGGGRAVTGIRFDGSGKRFIVDRETGPADVVALTGEVGSIGPESALRVVVAQHDYAHAVALATPHQIVEVGSGRTIARSDKSIEYLALSPYGDTLVFHDGETVWQVAFTGGVPAPLATYKGTLNAVMWAPDCNSVAILGHNPEVSLVDLSAKTTRELYGHTDQVYTAEFSRDGKTLLTAGDDGTARIWDLATGSSRVLRGHDDDVYRAHFSPDEKSVATSSLDGSARLWQIGEREARVLDEGKAIQTLDLEGDKAIVRTADSLARWDLTTGVREPLATWGADGGDPSPDHEHVAVKLPDLTIEVRGKRDDSPKVVLAGHKALVSRVAWSDDGLALFSSSFDGTLRRWDPATGRQQATVWSGDEPVRFFVTAPDGRLAARVGDKLVLIGTDGVAATTAICPLSMRFEGVRGRLVVQRCDHQLVVIDGDRQIELPTNGVAVARFAVSPTGGEIAGAMGNRAILVWDDKGHRIAELRGHSDLVYDVAFSPDGKRLASASYDKTVRVWDLAGEHSRVLRGHTAAVERVLWRGDQELVSASDDGTVRVWQAPSAELPSAADIARMLDTATSAAIDQRDRPTTLTRW